MAKIDDFSNIPPSVTNVLLPDFLERWKGSVSETEPDKAKEAVQQHFVYLLEMFWQSRFDKMHGSFRPMFDWISHKFLPEDVKYDGMKDNRILIVTKRSHKALATEIFDKVWDLYEVTPESGLVHEDKPSFMGRMFGMFR